MIPVEQQIHVCPSCKNGFLQEFMCITCGAQTLYDNTVKSQQAHIDALLRQQSRLREAAMALYMAGLWSSAGMHRAKQVALWEALRDALDLPKGTATDAGVGVILAEVPQK